MKEWRKIESPGTGGVNQNIKDCWELVKIAHQKKRRQKKRFLKNKN